MFLGESSIWGSNHNHTCLQKTEIRKLQVMLCQRSYDKSIWRQQHRSRRVHPQLLMPYSGSLAQRENPWCHLPHFDSNPLWYRHFHRSQPPCVCWFRPTTSVRKKTSMLWPPFGPSQPPSLASDQEIWRDSMAVMIWAGGFANDPKSSLHTWKMDVWPTKNCDWRQPSNGM